MSDKTFHQRLQELLEQANIEGALILVFRHPGPDGTPGVEYKLAINGMTQQEAIGNMIAGIGDMLLAGTKSEGRRGPGISGA